MGGGGVTFFFGFFFILVENIQNSKRWSKKKNFFFYFKHFEKEVVSFYRLCRIYAQKRGIFKLPPYLFSRIKILRSFQQSGILCLMIKLRQSMFKIDVHTPGTKYSTFCKKLTCKIWTNRAKNLVKLLNI